MPTDDRRDPARLRAGDVMTTSLVAVDADDSVLMAWELMTRARVHHMPVVSAGICVGLLEERQIAVQSAVEPLGLRRRIVRDLLDGVVDRVPADTPVAEVARRLLASRRDAVMVHGEDDALLGMVTVHDLVRALTGEVRPRPYRDRWTCAPTLFRLTPVLPARIPGQPAEGTPERSVGSSADG